MTFGIHPESTPDADVLRWRYTGAASEPESGTLEPLPDELTRLGVVAGTCEPGALVLQLGKGYTWRMAGADVRAALTSLLTAANTTWAVRPAQAGSAPSAAESDTDIEQAARAVIAEQLGHLAASHGGALELVDVSNGVVTVEMQGACSGCPAASMTLQGRFETALRQRVTGVRQVVGRPVGGCDERGGVLRRLPFLR